MAEATKVLYDVSQAIKELNKLNKKVEESGDKADDAFEDGSSSASLFDKALKKVSGTAGGTATKVKGVVTAIGGIGAVGATAAAAVGAIVAQFIDLDEILRDSIGSIGEFEQATQTILDTREAISNIGDQAVNRDIRFAQRSLRLARAENARAQNTVETERNAAKARLDVLKDELRRREADVKASGDREADLRDRLADRTRQDAGSEFAGFDADTQAAKLNQAARRAALEGDLDLAEELESKAQQAAAEAGNQAFALADQAKTRDAINSKLQEQIDKESEAGEAARGGVDEIQERVDALQREVDLLEKRATLLRQESREFGAQQQELRVQREEARDQQQADTAARTFEKNVRDFQNNIQRGGESFKETILNAGSEFANFFTDEVNRQAALRQFEQAGGAAGRISQAFRDEDGLTAQDVENLSGDFGNLTDAVARLQANRQRLSSGAEQQLQRLEALLKNVEGAFNAASDSRQVRTDDQTIAEGSRGPTGAQLDDLRSSLLGLTEAVREASRTESITQATAPAAQSQGAPQPVSSGPSQVTVNANVKGGIIDAEVTQKITEIIRRELRKQTTTPTQ